MPYAALIDWIGPYESISDLKAAAKEERLGETLYLAIGKRPRQRQSHIQYVGISTGLSTRFNGKHPIQTLLKADTRAQLDEAIRGLGNLRTAMETWLAQTVDGDLE